MRRSISERVESGRTRLRAAELTCLRPPVQLDVFTLLPHAFAWLTEQRPVAAVLGDELDLRLLSYRDYTPLALRAGRRRAVRRRRRAWCCASTSSPRLWRPFTAVRRPPRGRAQPAGAAADPRSRRGACRRGAVDAASSRFEGFDERIAMHLASDAISIGPYVLWAESCPRWCSSTRSRARFPGALAEGSGLMECSRTSSRAVLSTLTTRDPRSFTAGTSPTSSFQGTTGESTNGGRNRVV